MIRPLIGHLPPSPSHRSQGSKRVSPPRQAQALPQNGSESTLAAILGGYSFCISVVFFSYFPAVRLLLTTHSSSSHLPTQRGAESSTTTPTRAPVSPPAHGGTPSLVGVVVHIEAGNQALRKHGDWKDLAQINLRSERMGPVQPGCTTQAMKGCISTALFFFTPPLLIRSVTFFLGSIGLYARL